MSEGAAQKTDGEGYEIVCPDGHVRHYPYHNEDDALFDAKLCDETCKNAFGKTASAQAASNHARPVAFVHREHDRKGEA
jgi:hypothetical protein